MQTARELFIHELSDMLDGEQKILESLDEQIEESTRDDLKKLFQMHRRQTEGQVERLQQVIDTLGEEPESTECRGVAGLIGEHEAFKEEEPSEELLDVFNLGAASKMEHYEIAAYTGLIDMARKLGMNKAIRPLEQTLREEQQMFKRIESLMKKMKPESIGMEMEEEEEEETQPRRRATRRSGSRRRAA